jgi:predicted nucleotidyltransferase
VRDSTESIDAIAADRAPALAALCERHRIVLLMAFGSQAKAVLGWLRGEVALLRPGASDIDIGVKAEPGRRMSLRDQVAVAAELEDLLEAPRVDLVALDEADAFLAANIIRGERLHARDRRMADEYELYVLRRAGDLAPLERERMRMIEGRP